MGHYTTAYFCAGCKKEVSYHTRMYSNGRCPMCGYKGSRSATIMDTTEEAVYRPTLLESIVNWFKKK